VRLVNLLLLLGLALVIFWLYRGALLGALLYDDHLVITRPWLENPKAPHPIFSEEYYSWSGETSFRPLTTASYIFDLRVWGRAPWGFHLTSILLHVLATLSLAALGFRLGLGRAESLLAALLFGIHPLQVEAVASPAFREEPLTGLLIFLTLLLALPRAPGSVWARVGRAGLVFLTALLAMSAKELGWMLLLLLPLYRWAQQGRLGPWRELAGSLAPMLAATGVSLWLWLRWLPELSLVTSESSPPLAERLARIPSLLWFYVSKLLHPVNLGIDPAVPDLGFLAGMALLAALGALALLLHISGRRLELAGLAAGLICLLPVLQILPILNPVADRFAYVGLHGPALALGALAGSARRRRATSSGRRSPLLPQVLAAALLVLLVPLTARQIATWRDEESLFEQALLVNPRSPRALYNLGRLHHRRGRWLQAEAYYRAALGIDPGFGFVHYNLALVLAAQARWSEARAEFTRAHELLPQDPRPGINLGVLSARLGRLAEAARWFEAALEHDPGSLVALQNLLATYREMGRPEAAAEIQERIRDLLARRLRSAEEGASPPPLPRLLPGSSFNDRSQP
jgi:tetratricopeptide (TPR) repeat protein